MRIRTIPLFWFGALAACSDNPGMLEPETPSKPDTPIEVTAGTPIQDVLDRIVPAIPDRTLAAELSTAIWSAGTDPESVERILVRLETDASFAPDATAIRLALGDRR